MAARFVRHGVTYHFFSPRAIPGHAYRFIAYHQLLKRIAWDCAFAIDATDVTLFWLPACHTLPARKLLIASDTPGSDKWLHKEARVTWLMNTTPPSFHSYGTGGKHEGFLHNLTALRHGFPGIVNCGVVGGTREGFRPALDWVARRLDDHWRRYAEEYVSVPGTPAPEVVAGSDMVVWNEYAHAQTSETLMTGYPYGPVSYPFRAMLTPHHVKVVCRQQLGIVTLGACKANWLNATRGLYWFGHKTPNYWRQHHADPSAARYVQAGERDAPTCVVHEIRREGVDKVRARGACDSVFSFSACGAS